MRLLLLDFFARPSVEVAPDLLGCVLEHETDGGLVAVELTEVEAYAGASDPASHAYRGQTRRNAVMFGPPGHAYVYFTYGMYFCVNLVCLGEAGPAGREGGVGGPAAARRDRRGGGAGPGPAYQGTSARADKPQRNKPRPNKPQPNKHDRVPGPGPRPGPALPGARH